MPLIDEHVRAVGREVRELGRLHGELAQAELRDGLKRLALAIFLLGVAVSAGGMALAAGGFSLFLFFERFVSPPLAAALVAVVLVGFALIACLVAWRALGGSRSLLLPRTRGMVLELLRWHDEPTDS